MGGERRASFPGRCDIKFSGVRAAARGIPSARSVDHLGFTVPDLDEAVDFFTRVVGCDLLYRPNAAFDSTGGDWMSRHYGVSPRATLRTAMLRCGPGTNIELLAWDTLDAPRSLAARPGLSAGHLAIYVDDLQAAALYLASHPGVHVLGSPTIVTGEPNEGTEFLYVVLPWGMCLELVRWPPLMPYCVATATRLSAPASDWEERRTDE